MRRQISPRRQNIGPAPARSTGRTRAYAASVECRKQRLPLVQGTVADSRFNLLAPFVGDRRSPPQ